MCNNKEQLIGYLYDELPAAERTAFESHTAGCAECRRELKELSATRRHLTAWAPPEAGPDLRVVRAGAPVVSAPRRWSPARVPQWALAAAASVLLFAGAVALANLEIRYGADGVTVRTGWSGWPGQNAPVPADDPAALGPAAADPAAPASAGAPTSEEWKAAVGALERRLEEMEREHAAQLARISAGGSGISPAELRKILQESEARSRAELAVYIDQLWKDFNAARRSDLVRVQQQLAPEFQRQINSLRYQQAVSQQR